MQTNSKAGLVVLAALSLCGCKGKDKETNAADAAPSASVVVAPASASAAAPGTGPICLDPTATGKGTSSDPCKSKDPKFRAIVGKWTGGYSLGKAEFELTNKLPVQVDSADASVYYYDKAGKQLSTKNKAGKTFVRASSSGGILGSGIPKGESKKTDLGFYDEKTVKKCPDTCIPMPAGTTAIEIELDRVWWKDPRGEDGFVYWQNSALAPENRPMGGVK
jgi:hypothetical protein